MSEIIRVLSRQYRVLWGQWFAATGAVAGKAELCLGLPSYRITIAQFAAAAVLQITKVCCDISNSGVIKRSCLGLHRWMNAFASLVAFQGDNKVLLLLSGKFGHPKSGISIT
jgi:hypothetical protein